MDLPNGARSLLELDGRAWRAEPRSLLDDLDRSLALVLRSLVEPEQCAQWAQAVLEARSSWTEDFGGEQFALGRAFYTHVESGRAAEYFADARASDARVERALPGVQAQMRQWYGQMAGGVAAQRRGFAGAAAHVFPAGAKVARDGGVVHFDVEGLTPHQIARRVRALTLVVMLQPAESRGGLALWDEMYPTADCDHAPSAVLAYRPGDAALMDSYRLHQIESFDGARDRISLTLHGFQVDRTRWECWF